jgi:RNA polymerase sigma factor FliA
MCERQNEGFPTTLNAYFKLSFQGPRSSSNGGLKEVRKLDERLSLASRGIAHVDETAITHSDMRREVDCARTMTNDGKSPVPRRRFQLATHPVASESQFKRRISATRFPPQGFFHGIKAEEKPTCRTRPVDQTFIFAKQTDAERNQNVAELLPLLRRVANKMRANLPAHVEIDDLVGDGSLGLLDAVRKFDVRKGVKIDQYAKYRIRGAIIDGLRSMDGVSRDLRRKHKTVEMARSKMEAQLGRPATDQEMAESQGINLEDWHKVKLEIQPAGAECLVPMGPTAVKQITLESVVSVVEENQFTSCYQREKRDILNQALKSLSARERMIICLFYVHAHSMKEIGAKLKISASRVSQLHSAALVQLRSLVKPLAQTPLPGSVSLREPRELEAP